VLVFSFAVIRWFSLALLVPPPATFHDASGVAKCSTGPPYRGGIRTAAFALDDADTAG